MSERTAMLRELHGLVLELATRVQRLRAPIFDCNGVCDLVALSERIESLRHRLKMRRFIVFEPLGTGSPDRKLTPFQQNIIRFQVWDVAAGGNGVLGGLANNVFNDYRYDGMNDVNLPVVIDYLGRAEREIERLMAEWIENHADDDQVDQGGDSDAVESAVLGAVVAGGLAGVLQVAVGARAVDRVTAIIRERVAKDRRLYWWRADDWAAELRVTKKTVTDSDGWREVMAWRASNKADRVSKKTGK